MPIYDYTCENDHTFEARKGYDDEYAQCPECGGVAVRHSIYWQYLITETGVKESRRAEVPHDQKRLDKGFKLFREASEEMEYKHKQAEERAGRPLETTPYWQIAKKRADAIRAGKAPPLKGNA